MLMVNVNVAENDAAGLGNKSEEWDLTTQQILVHIGKKHALKIYDQFSLNTSCFWGSSRLNITTVVQFHKIFVTK